ncbi:MAG: ADOP family duplicated permease [Vicinamibacterales bacterium]
MKPRLEDEVSDELEFHLEMRTREYIARGMSRAEARDRALARFGDLAYVRKTCRDIGRRRDTDMRRREYLGELRQDVGFGLRQLAANPGFSLVAVLTLALGIGATTAIFSAVNAVVLRPLPFPEPERLAFVFNSWRGNLGGVSAGNFTDLSAEQRSFDSLTAIQYSSFNLSDGSSAERLVGTRVTAGYFEVFGVRPALGRTFRADEDQPGHEQVVVLSHRLWLRRFGADPAIVGRDIRMNGVPYEVVGVMPADFDMSARTEELWVPIAFTPARKAMHDEHYLTVVGRLARGVSRSQAQQEVDAIVAGLRQRFPKDDAALVMRVEPLVTQLVGDSRGRLLTLLGAVGFVLLIGCGNVANLLLARGAARARELAIRAALGAGRGRIVRQLLTESMVLALAATGAGLAIAAWGTRSLVGLTPPGVPRLEQASVDGTVLAFAFSLAIVSSVVFGLAPALRAARANVTDTLKEGGRGQAGAGRDWLRSLLITAEVALAVLLLVGAGLLIRSGIEAGRVGLGFDPAGLITARLSLPEAEYAELARVEATFVRLAEDAGRLAGVHVAALTSGTPMAPGGGSNGLVPEGKAIEPDNVVDTQLRIVSPEYFRAMGIPLRKGRGFGAGDRRGAQKVMILSEAAAAALFPGQDPLGRRVACCEPGPDGRGPDFKTVVGIAGDVRSRGPARPSIAEFYLPIAQVPPEAWIWIQRSMYIVARVEAGDPASLLPGLRAAVSNIDPDVPLFNVQTMDERLAGSLATARFNTLLLTLLGAIGLLLSAIGIYGVIAYFVTERTPEIGVRMALGATRGDVMRLVLRQAATPIALGLVAGLLASFAATRALAAQLVGVQRSDPLTLAVVVLALALTALAAVLVPAHRAAGVDPTRALHSA